MIIDIGKLKARGEYEGEFSYEFQPTDDKLLLPLCTFKGAAKAEGRYTIYDDDSVGVEFTLSYCLSGQCSYCLEKTEKRIEYQSDVLFVTDKQDGDNYYYDGRRLDMTCALNDALLFGQPEVLLCKEDCKGIKIK